MAIPSGIIVDPSSGSKNDTVSISASAQNTGRNNKTYTVTGSTTTGQSAVTINITQSGKPEFIEFDDNITTSVPALSSSVQISGTSNSSKLNITYSLNDVSLSAVQNILINGSTSVKNNTAITGDPGASAQYTFKTVVNTASNSTTNSRRSIIKVTTASGQSKEFTVTQAASAPYMYLNSSGTKTLNLTLTYQGAAQTVNILSNTDWTFN